MLCRTLLAPVIRGAENVPDGAVKERGCLFVGNHTQFGLYDLPFLMYELYLRGHKVLPPIDIYSPLHHPISSLVCHCVTCDTGPRGPPAGIRWRHVSSACGYACWQNPGSA